MKIEGADAGAKVWSESMLPGHLAGGDTNLNGDARLDYALGSGNVQYTADVNFLLAPRTGTISVGGATFTVYHAPGTCANIVPYNSQVDYSRVFNVPSTGGSFFVDLYMIPLVVRCRFRSPYPGFTRM